MSRRPSRNILVVLATLTLTAACGGVEEDKGGLLEDADGDGSAADVDCDDDDATRFPGADETCDGLDEDCDDEVDEDAVDQAAFYDDADGDGYGDPATEGRACEVPDGRVTAGGDCADDDPDVNPGADEVCAAMGLAVDDDCDGEVDEDPANGETFYADADGDGHGDPDSPVVACELPHGAAADSADCDDLDATVYLGASEVCDEQDNDCDGAVDDDDTDVDPTTYGIYYADSDGDGYGSPVYSRSACEAPGGYVGQDGDCDDGDGGVHPGVADTWYDGVDQDCGGNSDFDADLDGYDSDAHGGVDCDDADSGLNPGIDESVDCSDPVDYNCDGSVGLDDLDGDGWVACMECDDVEVVKHPYAWEDVDDGHDNDCDGAFDADDPDVAVDLALADDASTTVSLGGLTFDFCGVSWASAGVNSNGQVTFGYEQSQRSEDVSDFLGQGPSIAGLWDDLNAGAAAADGVYLVDHGDAVGIYWVDVPQYQGGGPNHFAVVLMADGRILLDYPAVESLDGLAGWSCGTGADVAETDLTRAWLDRVEGANGIGQGTEGAVYEYFTDVEDNDLDGATLQLCGTAGADSDGDGWTDTCGDTDDADPAIYPGTGGR